MRRTYSVVVLAIAAIAVANAPVRAQQPRTPVDQGAALAQQQRDRDAAQAQQQLREQRERDLARIVSLKVTITLSKYQGEKKVSSLPYELTVRTDNNKASIRMGTQVPTPTFGAPNPAAESKPAPFIGPFVMKDVGTNIDCTATNLDNGRYAVTVTIEDTSIYEDSQKADIPNGSKVSGVSATRTFRTTNALVLRDGQSTEFTTAVDKVSGDMIRATVAVAVIK
jgi:hypothetical protein